MTKAPIEDIKASYTISDYSIHCNLNKTNNIGIMKAPPAPNYTWVIPMKRPMTTNKYLLKWGLFGTRFHFNKH